MAKGSVVKSKKETDNNIKFVQKIEMYPVLYDKIIESFVYKNEVNEAWNEVAEYMGTPVPECKRKWNIIRTELNRNTQDHERTNKKTNKYSYLTPHVKFVIPERRKSTGDKRSIIDSDLEGDSEETDDLVQLREAEKRQKKDECYGSGINNNNPDMCFLRSLLPDLGLMNAQQKQKFKIGVLTLFSDIQKKQENQIELDTNFVEPIIEQEFVIKEEEI